MTTAASAGSSSRPRNPQPTLRGRRPSRKLYGGATWLLLRALFLGQLHLGGIELLLHPRHIRRIDFGGNGAVPLGERSLPIARGQLEASGLLVQIAEVVVDGGIGIDFLRSLQQIFFRQFIFSQPEISPADGIEIGAVGGIEIDGALDESERFFEL